MKKILAGVAALVIFLGYSTVVFASVNDALPLDQVIASNNPLASTVGAKVTLKITDKNITDTFAVFNVTATVLGSNTPLVLRADSGSNSSGALAKQEVAFANNFLGALSSNPFTYQLTDLSPGTTYYLQFVDTNKQVTYQKISFTTTGVGPNTPVPDQAAQQAALSVQMDNPTITENTSTSGAKIYDVKISGAVSSSVKQNIQLNVFRGDSSTSLFDFGSLLPLQILNAGERKTFDFTFRNLPAGTTYYYQVYDKSKNPAYAATGTLSFVTGGTAGTPSTPYNPNNDPGGLIKYTFPTNIGEPTGDGTTSSGDTGTPLVPCGKISDKGTVNEDCHFSNLLTLIQNIINYLFVLLIPTTVLVAVYTGVQMILHRSVPKDLEKYKKALLRIGIGVAVMVLAWTVISTLFRALLGPGAGGFDLLGLLG